MSRQLIYTVQELFTTDDKAKPGQPAGLADYELCAFPNREFIFSI